MIEITEHSTTSTRDEASQYSTHVEPTVLICDDIIEGLEEGDTLLDALETLVSGISKYSFIDVMFEDERVEFGSIWDNLAIRFQGLEIEVIGETY